MPRVAYQGFVGPTNTVFSRNVNMERTINAVLELASPGTPKATPYLRRRPGIRRHVLVSDSPIRGLFAQDGRAFAVGGTDLVEFYEAPNTYDVRGTVSDTGISGGVGDSCSFATNGSAGDQLAVSGGGSLYVLTLSTNAFAQVTDADLLTPVYMIGFVDGYGISLHALTRQWQISALEDFTSWSSLDVYEVSRTSDNLVNLATSHGQVWLFGSKTADVWANNGDPNTPFAPATGGFLEVGSIAPFACCNFDNTLVWLGQTADGRGVVYRADGYSAKRISDQGLEYYLSQATRLDNAIAWTCLIDGHNLYMLYVPDLYTTLAYDVTIGTWHEWAWWDGSGSEDSDFVPFVGRNHCFAFGKHFVGDRQSRAIYELSFAYADDLVTECA